MKIQPIFDINSVDRSEFAEMGNLLEQTRNSFYRGMLSCQEQCIRQLIDAGLDPSDFILLEKTETRDYTMTYKCWAQRRVKQ